MMYSAFRLVVRKSAAGPDLASRVSILYVYYTKITVLVPIGSPKLLKFVRCRFSSAIYPTYGVHMRPKLVVREPVWWNY